MSDFREGNLALNWVTDNVGLSARYGGLNMNLDPARLFKLNPHNLGNKESRLYNTLKVEPRSHPNLQIRHTYNRLLYYIQQPYIFILQLKLKCQFENVHQHITTPRSHPNLQIRHTYNRLLYYIQQPYIFILQLKLKCQFENVHQHITTLA